VRKWNEINSDFYFMALKNGTFCRGAADEACCCAQQSD
jgi:hypothetical protein